MIKLYRVLFLAFLLGICMLTVSFANEKQSIEKLTKLSTKTAGGQKVSITIHVRDCPFVFPFTQKGLMWGSELEPPKTMIGGIDISVSKEQVYVPLSAYFDLTDPNDYFLEATKKGFMIIIRGGDAASSYKAELIFEGVSIKRKRVSLSEFPDEVWEETTYSFITNSN